ncbi:MAG: enoyl-CoA hydratase/isomerase family protein [Alphaproteobacteria bacterium]|nr:enoyl-CoA hydratase/isomerase family protein [Alphaproteobacteria bacterium]
MIDPETLLLRDEMLPGVVRLTFNRPDKLNALSSTMLAQLASVLEVARTDPAVRCIVLAGAGEKAFVAGADIGEYQGGRNAAFCAYQIRSRAIFDALETFPKPTIAMVNGFALGGGFEIALCCDTIICSTEALFGLPEGRLGLCPGGGGSQRLTRMVGKYVASDIMLNGWRISGERAYSLGLAVECCAPEKLEQAVLTRARALLKIAPLAQKEMKRLISEGADASLATAKSLEQEVLFRLYTTRDAQEGIDAFLEKREPNFKGEERFD